MHIEHFGGFRIPSDYIYVDIFGERQGEILRAASKSYL